MRLSLILPTYNEAANLPELLRRVHEKTSPFEVIVVDDDSPDGTWRVAEELKKTYPHLRVLRRVGKKGLSSAVTDGADMATGDVVAVMDSDLQHDPSLVAQLAQKIEGGADIAVASRYREGGSVGDWVRGRRWLSKLGAFIARKLPNVETSDPMSGFFALRRDVYVKARPLLVPEGFKILFELLAAIPRGSSIAEVPLHFQPRLHGESKLSLWVQVQFLKQALRIGLRRIGLSGARMFAAVAIVLALAFAWRTWNLLPIYVSAEARNWVHRELLGIAGRNGWLLSDMHLLSVGQDGLTMTFIHRVHGRGIDARDCWFVRPADDLIPCTD